MNRLLLPIFLTLIVSFTSPPTEAFNCVKHPKICNFAHNTKAVSVKTWKGFKWFCQETLVPIQWTLATAALIILL